MWVIHWRSEDGSESGVVGRTFDEREKKAVEAVLAVADSTRELKFVRVAEPKREVSWPPSGMSAIHGGQRP